VHEPRAGHRLDHPAHRLPARRDPPDQAAQPIRVGRRSKPPDDLAGLVDQETSSRLRLRSNPACMNKRREPEIPRLRSLPDGD
jgi:hypothetical protein